MHVSRFVIALGERFALLCSLLVLTSCSGEHPTPPPAPTPVTPALAQLSLTPGIATLSVGSTQSFAVEARTAAGLVVAAPNVTWSVADTSLLTVSAGTVTARRIGTTVLVATSGGVQAQASIVVTPASAPVASISLSAPTVIMAVGRSAGFSAVPRAADGSPTVASLAWTSSNTTIATVDGQGIVRGVAPGAATIRVASGAQSASVIVTVYAPSQLVTVEPDANVVTGTQSIVGNAGRLTCDFRYTVRSVSVRGTWQDVTWLLQSATGGTPVTRTDALTRTAFTEGSTLALRGNWYWDITEANQPRFRPFTVTVTVGYLDGGVRRETEPVVLYCTTGSAVSSTALPTVASLDPSLSAAARAQLVGFVSATDSVPVANNQPMTVPGRRNVVAALNRGGDIVLAGLAGDFTTPVTVQSTAQILIRLLMPPGAEIATESETLDRRMIAHAEFPSLVTVVRAQAERGESFASAASVAQATKVVRGLLESATRPAIWMPSVALSNTVPVMTRYPDLSFTAQGRSVGGTITVTSRAFVLLTVEARPPNVVLTMEPNSICGILCLDNSISQPGTITSASDGPFTLTARYPTSEKGKAIRNIGVDLATGVGRVLGLPDRSTQAVGEKLLQTIDMTTLAQSDNLEAALKSFVNSFLGALPDLLVFMAEQASKSWASVLLKSLFKPLAFADAGVWLAGRVGAYADLGRYWSAAPETVDACWKQGTLTAACPIAVTVTPAALTLKGVDSVGTLTATITGATNTALRWRSENPAIASVVASSNGSTATVRATAVGTTTVRVSSVQDSTAFAVASITVTPRIAIAVTPSTATLLVGGTQQLTAAVTGSTNTSVLWRSSADAIASVDAAGRVTARAPGSAIITARPVADTTVQATSLITVTQPTIAISVSPTSASIPVGGTQLFVPTVTGLANGQSGAILWTNSTPSVATASVSGNGILLTALAAGTTTLTFRPEADQTKSATAVVTVTPATTGTATRLTSAVPVTGLAGAAGSSRLYVITVPTGATKLTVQTSGGTGDVDLFVRRGSAPTTSVFDCTSQDVSTVESCAITNPVAGEWYILLSGYTAYSGVTITATITTGGTTPPPSSGPCSSVLEIPVAPSEVFLSGSKVYGCRSIPGANILGTYTTDGIPGYDPMILNADGTGTFTYADSQGLNTPIRWWVHVNADGSYVKDDFPTATRYYLIWFDQRMNKWYRDELVVQSAANGYMEILYRRKNK